jgi:hypothetical protein
LHFLRTASLALSLCSFVASLARCQQPFHAIDSAVAPVRASGNGRLPACHIIYLGFVGALEPSGNRHSGIVQIRDTLHKDYTDVCAKSFSPYSWTDGRDWLLQHFPAHSGVLTPEERATSPKIILLGHSMGGWAMISVARELRSREIPVELTVQVDSVGITDYTIPRNVKAAAIFHANDVLVFMTTKHLRLEDPNHTKLIADITVAGAGHESVTRDPRIRDLVLQTVEALRRSLSPAPRISTDSAKE